MLIYENQLALKLLSRAECPQNLERANMKWSWHLFRLTEFDVELSKSFEFSIKVSKQFVNFSLKSPQIINKVKFFTTNSINCYASEFSKLKERLNSASLQPQKPLISFTTVNCMITI
jgi:hypothetical protein